MREVGNIIPLEDGRIRNHCTEQFNEHPLMNHN
jgi:hypothetical protein